VIDFLETAPDTNVDQAEYTRLLGYPRGTMLTERALELAEEVRNWYRTYGRPWVFARAASVRISEHGVIVDGVPFRSGRLRHTLEIADAYGAVLVAVSAGLELEAEAQRRWRDEKPDEYFFLEVYGSAVVEHLVTMAGARLCEWADGQKAAVLPHYSPGYPDWSIDEQARLLELIQRTSTSALPIDVLESGMLRPKKSLLAVFGLTQHVDRVGRLSDLSPCENCSFGPCQYRRAPYRRGQGNSTSDAAAVGVPEPLTQAARYSVSLKALKRWSAERLVISTRTDGSIEAVFKYEGTTCTNMGRPLHFLYHVTLGPRDEGYPIRKQRCGPAPGDDGYTFMCRYRTEGGPLLETVESEQPLHGQRLDEVLRWTRATSPAGCYCEAESRQHKWGLVLETIHYALCRGMKPGPIQKEAERS
jgi:hypothetical protein